MKFLSRAYKPLRMKPEKNLFLSEINNALHTLLLPEFEKAENGYYLTGYLVPPYNHCNKIESKPVFRSKRNRKANLATTGSCHRRACSLPVFAIFGIEEIRTEQIISAKPYSQHSLLFRWKLLLR